MQAAKQPESVATRWWQEWEIGLLLLVVLAIYFSRLTALPIRAEETRRAMVAREILWTGDWIVPRQQNEPFLSRPPLGSYPIAFLAMVLGDTTLLATRLPTALATLLTTLLIYGYARQFLSRTGSLASALGYASMGQVLQLGQIAETEATFTLLVAGSLLLWHWGFSQGWSKYATWSLAYFCVALGALTKGPQAPVYFAATVGAFLLYQRQWKALFHPAHFVGIGVLAFVLGAWQLPFAWQLGWPAVEDVWAGDVGLRFVDQNWQTTLAHLASFPAEIWVCLLPSSLLLCAWLRPSFWKAIKPQGSWISFAIIAIVVTFPTCWFVPGARPRYYMPLYPCFAPLVGLVVEELLRDSSRAWLAGLWKTYQRVMLATAVGLGVVVLAMALTPDLPWPALRQSIPSALAVALVCAGAGWGTWTVLHRCDALSIRRTLIASTALAGALYTGLIINISLVRSEDVSQQVAELKAGLPEGTQLASFGLLETMFTYHYAEPVTLLPAPQAAGDVPAECEYFCLNREAGRMLELPFAWQKIAVISCERWKRENPNRAVIVGRRLKNESPTYPPHPTVADERAAQHRLESRHE